MIAAASYWNGIDVFFKKFKSDGYCAWIELEKKDEVTGNGRTKFLVTKGRLKMIEKGWVVYVATGEGGGMKALAQQGMNSYRSDDTDNSYKALLNRCDIGHERVHIEKIYDDMARLFVVEKTNEVQGNKLPQKSSLMFSSSSLLPSWGVSVSVPFFSKLGIDVKGITVRKLELLGKGSIFEGQERGRRWFPVIVIKRHATVNLDSENLDGMTTKAIISVEEEFRERR
ncbi:unnamed protein product [Ilex paraguariensis]|uniref:Uncharacterized protein n=1 Tax=Ilex paraguariensis TaxID=185542 RepID=A0ABC8QMV0_9AQUA